MKSRFTYGMFAGFALACLFFFFFLFFFPKVFRTLTAKNYPSYPNPVAVAQYPAYYDHDYLAYSKPSEPMVPTTAPAGYRPEVYTAYVPDADYAPAYDAVNKPGSAPYGMQPGPIAYYDPRGDGPYDDSMAPYPPTGLS